MIEATFRYSDIATVFHSVQEEFEDGGPVFTEHTRLAFARPLANRDPEAFPDPMRFDPERKHTSRHVAFGRGLHLYLGQFLARNPLEEGLHLITRRINPPSYRQGFGATDAGGLGPVDTAHCLQTPGPGRGRKRRRLK